MWIIFCGTFKLGATLEHVFISSYTKSSRWSRGQCRTPIVYESRPARAFPKGWKKFCLHAIWMSFKERQCVAELGINIGILYLATGKNRYERRWAETCRSADSAQERWGCLYEIGLVGDT